MSAPAPNADTPPARRWPRLALMLSLPLVLAAFGAYVWLNSGHSVSTDNAYVQQNKVSISAEVGGRVTEVAVHENQRVRVGDLLFRIDPAPYRIALAQADADIAAAEARVTTMEITAGSMDAGIATARDAVRFAETNLARERALMARGFNTRARLDTAELRLTEARGRLADAQMTEVRAEAQLATGASAPGVNPALLSARARRDAALLNLSRTEVRAPVAGIISQSERLQVGQMIVTGLPSVSIVGDGTSWIEANFKETDLNRMRVGQHADVDIDAYDGLRLSGHVVSIGAGTGSEFSVLPAQNATGNWVKVTQRVPVRIAIDGTPGAAPPRAMIAGAPPRAMIAGAPPRALIAGAPPRALIAGLSAHVRVYFDDSE